MSRHRFVQVDVFTDKVFSGNPLAVFPDADEIDERVMQQIAREMNLSETVFVTGSRDERALRRLRIFTPTTELPLAGHPVVGAWNVLARPEYGGIVSAPANGTGVVRVEHELGVGVLPVDVEFMNGAVSRVVMTQGAFVAGAIVTEEDERAEIAASLGLKIEDLDAELPIQTIATGIPTLAVPVSSLDLLGSCQPDYARIRTAHTNLDAFSLYAFTRETHRLTAAAHARLFAPDMGVAEDPATGSAAGSLGAYLVYHSAIDSRFRIDAGAHEFIVEQGDFIHRPSRIAVGVTGGAGVIAETRVGGSSVVVAEGELLLE